MNESSEAIRIRDLKKEKENLQGRIDRAMAFLQAFGTCVNRRSLPPHTRAINDACEVLDSGMTCEEHEAWYAAEATEEEPGE